MFKKTIHQKVKVEIGSCRLEELVYRYDTTALYILMLRFTSIRHRLYLVLTEVCCFELQN